MLKNYLMPNGHTYQFEETEAPEGAVLVEKVKEKAVKPANKSRKAETK